MSAKENKIITVVQLYPNEMNIYGDRGNVLTLLRRLEWHGYTPRLAYHHPGKPFPKEADLIVGGGGQDSGQDKVQSDLLTIGDTLHQLADDGTPMLMICGLYQLFGRFFETQEGKEIKGIGIFDAETYGKNVRLIGNIVINTPYGEVVGYENHSGHTYLGPKTQPFGTVIKGAGNNSEDRTEGAVYRSVVGSYLHGSLLPKNPAFADALIEQATIKKFGDFEGTVIPDELALKAHAIAKKRPR
ncbi:glutamine amidotransferase [Candidatus Saccharibacteria bacterium]|nr:MAG: glutamine amidotransferase [Candidatus Saccharibacteria bacterium]